ncbi:MAG: YggS family pyridoxal phosphate-dependent enzyme [Miltoncostaeaceae bacterium]
MTERPDRPLDTASLEAAVGRVREELDAAARVSGRGAGAVELVLAGKYIPAEDTPALIAAGVGVVGENRLQDLTARAQVAAGALTFDFIGHIQRKKVRDILPAVRLIHSLDSERLAAEIARRAEGEVRVLVELNIAEESTKGGILPQSVRAFVEDVSVHADLVIGGLMAMPPKQDVAENSRPFFDRTRRLAEDLRTEWAGRHDFRDLSMGTSQDYVVAAEEGATMVRVGRGLLADSGTTGTGIL